VEPVLTLDTDATPVEDAAARLIALLRERRWLKTAT